MSRAFRDKISSKVKATITEALNSDDAKDLRYGLRDIGEDFSSIGDILRDGFTRNNWKFLKGIVQDDKRRAKMKVFLSPDEGGAFADLKKVPPAPFEYEPLPDGRRLQTRVLTLRGGNDMAPIECWVDALDLDDTGLEYEALSYCWGDVKKDELTPIYCNGRRLDDMQERARQVPKMGEIYRRAARVVVWLGEIWEAYMTAFDILRYLAGVYDELTLRGGGRTMEFEELKSRVARLTMEGYPASMSFKRAFHIVQEIEAAPWFSRMWVLQEVALAQSVALVAGRQTLAWETFEKAMLVRALVATQDRRLRKVMFRHLDHGVLKVIELRMAVVGGRQDRSILTLMNQFRAHKATAAADKIYAILSLTDTDMDDIGLLVDYNIPTAALYTDLAKGILLMASAGGLDILSVPRVDSELASELPSWVPDWSNNAQDGARALAATVTRYGSGTFCASGRRLADGQKPRCEFKAGHQLVLRGSVVDRIERLSTHAFTDDSDISSGSTTSWPEQMRTNTYPPTGEMLGISYLRTLCADSFPPQLLVNLDSDTYKMLFRALDHWLDLGTGYPHGMWGLLQRLQPQGRGLPEVEFPQAGQGIDLVGMMDTMLGRRLMWSRDGYFGAVPAQAREGDAIVLVEGCRVPLVLRQAAVKAERGETDTCWQLVGDCFMHGAMYGERWDDGALCEEVVLV
ncbi:hypothetical protein V8F20_006193 [Naviculisporaceae sp. PSN 640]